MGLRLYSEFHSSTDKLFKVEIHDSSFAGTAQDFVVASDGFTLNYSGETDDIVSPIISSNCTVSAYNQDAFFDNFITDLKQYQENRFTLKVVKADIQEVIDYVARVIADGGTIEAEKCLRDAILDLGVTLTYSNYWAGIIMQDLVTVEDTHKPYIFSITAVDGIGHLANKPYESISNVTIESFIESAVNAIDISFLYSATDTYYGTVVNVWDTQQTYSATTDVTTLTRFNTLVYSEKEEDGTITYSSYFDILKELCIAFGARFYQKDGAYYFEQYMERKDATRYLSSYYKAGTKIGTVLVSDDVTLDGTTGGGARLAGNQFNFLPALKKVQVSYNQERSNNLLANRLTYTGATGRQDLGFVVDDNNGKIQVTGQLIYQLNHNGNAGTVVLEFWRPVWQLELRIEDAANPGTFYYLKRDWSPSGGQLYGATSWTTTPSYYHIDAGTGKNDTSGAYISNTFSLVTPPLPVDGEAQLDVNYYRVYDGINNTLKTIPVYFDETNQVKEVTATFFNDNGGISNVTVYSATNTSANINSNLILDLGELRVSDSLGLQGSFYVYDGSAWVPSTQWRRGNSGSYTSLLKLLTKEVLSLHKKPIERYSGTIVGPYSFGIRYEFDKSYWLPMSGTYNANLDEWSSEWFKIESSEADIAIAVPVGTGGGADFVGRVSSQQGTDEVLNGVEITVTTSEVTGNSTVGGTLGVTGNINASSDIIASGNLSATDVIASNDITATGNVIAVDVTASGNISAVDVEASGDILADGAVSADSLSAANNISGNTVSATTSVSGGSLSVTNNATIGGNVSATDVGATNITASNNITASGLLTAGNASLDNFVTKTAIIGSSALLDSFKTRVENDGGTFEAFAAVLDAITPLLIGTAEKSAVIYGETSVETLDASNNITAAGNVSATNVNASNNATVGGTLGVTGGSTLAATSVGAFTTTSSVNVTINSISATPGGSATLSVSNHFNFITYSGGTGTYTLTLPSAQTGLIMRFKTDDTIVANKTITLTPQSGERIDAEASYVMDRSYDGITLLGNDTGAGANWYIIQKKEK